MVLSSISSSSITKTYSFEQSEETWKSIQKSLARITQLLEERLRPSVLAPGVVSHTAATLLTSDEPPMLAPRRSMRLDQFPRFDAMEARQWISTAEEYFSYYKLTDPYRLRIAAIYLDELPWFQELQKSKTPLTWSVLAKAIESTFVPSAFDYPCDEARAMVCSLDESHVAEDAPDMFEEMPERAPETAIVCTLSEFTVVEVACELSPDMPARESAKLAMESPFKVDVLTSKFLSDSGQQSTGFLCEFQLAAIVLGVFDEMPQKDVPVDFTGNNDPTDLLMLSVSKRLQDVVVAEFSTVRHQLEVLEDRLEENSIHWDNGVGDGKIFSMGPSMMPTLIFNYISSSNAEGDVTILECCGQGEMDKFVMIPGAQLPGESMTVGNAEYCQSICVANCSCVALTYIGAQCSVWKEYLFVVWKPSYCKGMTLSNYLRMAVSEIITKRSSTDYTVGLIIGIVGRFIICSITALILILRFYRRRSNRVSVGMHTKRGLLFFGYGGLMTFTKHYSERQGGGSFGSVSKGTLPNMTLVAVKMFKGSRQDKSLWVYDFTGSGFLNIQGGVTARQTDGSVVCLFQLVWVTMTTEVVDDWRHYLQDHEVNNQMVKVHHGNDTFDFTKWKSPRVGHFLMLSSSFDNTICYVDILQKKWMNVPDSKVEEDHVVNSPVVKGSNFTYKRVFRKLSVSAAIVAPFAVTLKQYKEQLFEMEPSTVSEDDIEAEVVHGQAQTVEQEESLSASCFSHGDKQEKVDDAAVPDIGKLELTKTLLANPEAGLHFAKCITSEINTIVPLLASSAVTDVETTILWLIRCKQFQLATSGAYFRKTLPVGVVLDFELMLHALKIGKVEATIEGIAQMFKSFDCRFPRSIGSDVSQPPLVSEEDMDEGKLFTIPVTGAYELQGVYHQLRPPENLLNQHLQRSRSDSCGICFSVKSSSYKQKHQQPPPPRAWSHLVSSGTLFSVLNIIEILQGFLSVGQRVDTHTISDIDEVNVVKTTIMQFPNEEKEDLFQFCCDACARSTAETPRSLNSPWFVAWKLPPSPNLTLLQRWFPVQDLEGKVLF